MPIGTHSPRKDGAGPGALGWREEGVLEAPVDALLLQRRPRLLESRARGARAVRGVPSRAQEWGAHSLPLPAWKGSLCVCGASVPVLMLVSAQQVRTSLLCPPVSVPACAHTHKHMPLVPCETMDGSAGSGPG